MAEGVVVQTHTQTHTAHSNTHRATATHMPNATVNVNGYDWDLYFVILPFPLFFWPFDSIFAARIGAAGTSWGRETRKEKPNDERKRLIKVAQKNVYKSKIMDAVWRWGEGMLFDEEGRTNKSVLERCKSCLFFGELCSPLLCAMKINDGTQITIRGKGCAATKKPKISRRISITTVLFK